MTAPIGHGNKQGKRHVYNDDKMRVPNNTKDPSGSCRAELHAVEYAVLANFAALCVHMNHHVLGM